MEYSSLAIVGAGPKAIALICKAFALKKLGFKIPKIYLIEKDEVAAHWSGNNGYTNGHLPLGTSPDKDLGFPYSSNCWGEEYNADINKEMQNFSWQSYLIAQKKYSAWVDRGRPAPHHEDWASYLKWAFDQVSEVVEFLNVKLTSIELKEENWQLCLDGHAEKLEVAALIMTGPGKEFIPGHIPQDERILRVKSFWDHLATIDRTERDLKIAVVGTGENAASIAVSLINLSKRLKIDIISPFAMNYSRGESFVENHMYTDPFRGNWHHLTPEDRRNFINRTDRGVFSVETKKHLDHAEYVEVIPGRFMEVEIDSSNQLLLVLEYNGQAEKRIYDYVVMACGFDPLAALNKLLTKQTKKIITDTLAIEELTSKDIEMKIDEYLSLERLSPKLHLPMLAAVAQGPGFPNLSCLGRLSDQVLVAHTSLDH